MNAYRTDANSSMMEEHRRLQHPPTASTYEHLPRDDERLLPRGGIVSRTPSSATATAKTGGTTPDCDDDLLCDEMIDVDEDDALFTFHPVDEPDVEVDVSNIFQASSSVAKVGGSSVSGSDEGSAESPSDRGAPNKESTATSRPRKRAHSQLSLHAAPPLGIPTCISDEEEGSDDDGDQHNRDDEDASVSYTRGGGMTFVNGSSSSTTGSSHALSSWTMMMPPTTTLCAEVSVAAAFPKAPSAVARAPELCELAASVSDPVASEEPVESSPGDDDDKVDSDDESDSEDDDDEDDDNYETRKRKEEEGMDEEQLRKKRKIEEEERIARNNLWRQSIKRSMFLEPPGAVLAKRATM